MPSKDVITVTNEQMEAMWADSPNARPRSGETFHCSAKPANTAQKGVLSFSQTVFGTNPIHKKSYTDHLKVDGNAWLGFYARKKSGLA